MTSSTVRYGPIATGYVSPFPVVAIAATSCDLCVALLHMKGDLDLAGLTGVFLTNGLVANQTLLTDLTPLAAGHQLRWIPGKGGREIATYRPAIHDRYRSLTFEDTWQLLDERTADAVRRHRRAESSSTLMLSGTLDSRMPAGYLAQSQTTDSALVLGRDTDHEVRAAVEVARVLGLKLHREPQEPTELAFLAAARRGAEWEHLSGGFSSFETDAAATRIGRLGQAVWAGYAGDISLGGSAIGFSRDPRTESDTFEQFLSRINQWGVPDVVFNVPEKHLQRQQLQYVIINASFPRLAEIAQDTNSFVFEPAWRTARREATPLRRLSVSLRRSGRTWYWRR